MHSAGFEEDGPDSAAAMEHAYKWILKYGGGLAFILIIAWPCLALPAGVFSKGYFTFWVIISIIWGLVSLSASACSAIMPSCSHVWCRQRVSSAVAIALPGCRRRMAWGVLCPQILLCVACYRLIATLAWALISHADRSCQPLLQVWSTTVIPGADEEIHCASAER